MASTDQQSLDTAVSLDPVLTQRTQGPSPEDEKVIVAERDKGVLARLATAEASGPTIRQRTQSEIIDLTLLQNTLGNPFSTRWIPFEQMREMTTDLMLAFGWWMTLTQLARAEYSFQSPDAQLAAAVDAAYRPISVQTLVGFSNDLFFGHQPAVKRFKLGRLEASYRDPDGQDPDKDLPVWNSSADALLWRPPAVLNPSHCLPQWDEDGQMVGFKFSQTPIPHNDLISAASAYGYMVIPGHFIGPDFALWTVNEAELNFGCQPPDEQVLTTEGYVAIGDLNPDAHRLVSYGQNKISRGCNKSGEWMQIARCMREEGKSWGEIAEATGLNSREAAHARWYRWQNRSDLGNGYRFEKGERHYSGDLMVIKSQGGRQVRITPNHKLTVRWSVEARNHWAVYLMRRGNWWRIGITKLHPAGKTANAGIGMRVQGEKADCAWVLGIFDNKRDALYHEKLWGNQYHIPDIAFESVGDPTKGPNCITRAQLHSIWDVLDSETGSLRVLKDRDLYVEYPFYVRNSSVLNNQQIGSCSNWTIFAANLMPGFMELPLDPGEGSIAEWSDFDMSRQPYDGPVVSLEVYPYHHYVTNGIITQNSCFGSARTKRAYPFWWSFWFRWRLADRTYENLADPVKLVYYPIDFEQYIDPEDAGETNPMVRRARQTAIEIGRQARSGATVAMPGTLAETSDGHVTQLRKWDMKYLDSKNNFSELDATFRMLDTYKLRAFMIPENAFIEGQGSRTAGGSAGGTGGARMASQLGQIYEESNQALVSRYDDVINEHFIPQFIAANFPEKVGTPCRKVSRALGVLDDQTRSQILQLIGQVRGEVLPVNTRALLEQMNVPLLNERQMKAEIKQISELAALMGPPEQDPQKVGTQGYNAGVMKTKKGPNLYVQPPQRIVLAESDGFMNSLPDTPHYRDAAVRSAMVRLRRLFLDRYREQYASFVEFLKQQPTLHLAEQGQKKSGLDEKQAQAAAVAIVALWASKHAPGAPGSPSQVVGGEVGQKFADLSGLIALRGGKTVLKSARLEAQDFGEEAVQPWVADRVKFALDSIDNTVRGEVRDWLSSELQESVDPSTVSSAAEDQFADFPMNHTDRAVRTEVRDAFNRGTLEALHRAGVAQVQAVDASDGTDLTTDPECLARQGRVYTVEDAMGVDEHPNGTLGWVPLTTESLSVERVERLPSHLAAEDQKVVFDPSSETLFLAEEIDEDQERALLLILGDQLAY